MSTLLTEATSAELELELERRSGATPTEIDELELRLKHDVEKIRSALEARVQSYDTKQRAALARCEALVDAAWPEICGRLESAQVLLFRVRLRSVVDDRERLN